MFLVRPDPNMLHHHSIETKLGAKGATDIQQCFMNPALPLLLITRYAASIPTSLICYSSQVTDEE